MATRRRKTMGATKRRRPTVRGVGLAPNPGSLIGAAASIARNFGANASTGGGYSTPTVGRAFGRSSASTAGRSWERQAYDTMRRVVDRGQRPPTFGEIAKSIVSQPNVVGMSAAGYSSAMKRGLDATGLDYPLRRGLIPSSKGPTARRKTSPTRNRSGMRSTIRRSKGRAKVR